MAPPSMFNPEQILRQTPSFSYQGPIATDSVVVGGFSQPVELNVVEYKKVLVDVLVALRKQHREQLPVSFCGPNTSSTFSEFVQDACLAPVLKILNRFRDSSLPMLSCKSTEVLSGHGLCVTLHEKSSFPGEATMSGLVPVVFLFLLPGKLDLNQWENGNIHSSTATTAGSIIAEVAQNLLERKAKHTVVTDTQSSLVLSSRDCGKGESAQTLNLDIVKVTRHNHTLPLRLFLAAYTYASVSREYLSRNLPSLAYYARGALNNPELPLPTDAEIFATCKCHSDFDLYTMQNDRRYAEQFFRWKDSQKHDGVSNALVEGDILTAVTNGFFERHIPLKPRYPLDLLPESTTDFLNINKRPMLDPHVSASLKQSETFSFEITRVVHAGQAKTLAGRIVSIDSKPSPVSSEIIIKLFDDSLLPKPTYNPADNSPREWFIGFRSSEDIVKIEDAAYRRLEHAQGSLIPFYYGAHLFKLPSGWQVYGLAVEFIDGLPSDETPLAELSDKSQISFIKSAREGVRVFQAADISQADWHEGQILCPPTDGGDRAHQCVFIDLASTRQPDPCYNVYRVDDYGEVKEILKDVGLREELIESYYEPRERWDQYGPPRDDFILE